MKIEKLCVILLAISLLSGCSLQDSKKNLNEKLSIENGIKGPEVGLYTQLRSGIFYTNPYVLKDKAYIELREESIDIFNNQIDQMITLCKQLYVSTESYKTTLLMNLDRPYDPETLATRKVLLQTIVNYNIAIESYLDEINGYQSIDSEMSKNIADNLVFGRTIDLFNTLDRYLAWLVKSNDVLSYMTDDESLTNQCHNYYKNDITPVYVNAFNKLLALSDIHSYIASADYYKNKALMVDLDLSDLKDNDDVIAIRNMQELVKDQSEPSFLITPPIQKASDLGMVSLLNLKNDKESLADNVLLMTGFLAYKQNRDGYVSQENIDDMMMFIILNTDTNKKGQNDILDYLKDNNYDFESHQSTQTTHHELLQEVIKKEPEIESKLNAMFVSKIKQDDLNEFASKISTGQMALLAASFLQDSNALFSTITNVLSDMLLKNEGELDPEVYHSIDQMIKHDLEEILGDQKEAFVNKVIHTNADEIIEKFSKWQDASSLSTDLLLDKNTLLSLLEVFDLKIEDVKTVADSSEEAKNDNPPASNYSNLNITRTDLGPQEFFNFTSKDDPRDIIMKLYGVDLKEAVLTNTSEKSEIIRYTFTQEPYRAVIVEMNPDDSSLIYKMTMVTTYQEEAVSERAYLSFYNSLKPILYQRMRIFEDVLINENTALSISTGDYYPIGMQFTFGYPTGADVTEYLSEVSDYGEDYVYNVRYQFDGSLIEEIFYEYTSENTGTYNHKKYYLGAFDNQIHFDINGIFTYDKLGFAHNYDSVLHGSYTEYDRVNGKTNIRQFVNGKPQ